MSQLGDPPVPLPAHRFDGDDDRLVWGLAVDAAGVGAWDWKLTTGELRFDERLMAIFGLDDATFDGTIDAWGRQVVAEDFARVSAALQEAMDTCGVYEAEYRIVRPSGEMRWIRARGQAFAGPDGAAERVVGAAYDTTDVREGEARIARVLETMATGYYQLDHEWRFAYVNAEAERILGLARHQLLGGTVWELFPATVGSEFETSFRRAVDTGEPVTFEAHYPAPLDGWYEIRAWPTIDGLAVYFLDVTARRLAQDRAARAADRAALLAEVTRTLTDTLDGTEAVRRLARLVVPGLGDWCIVTLLDPNGPTSGPGVRNRLNDAGWHHRDPALLAVLERFAQLRIPALSDDDAITRALEGPSSAVVVGDATRRLGAALDDAETRALFERLAPESALMVQLRGRDRVVGLLSVFRDSAHRPFSEADAAALRDVAGRAGLALDNARLYRDQQELAEGLQRSLLTEPPLLHGLEVVARYVPAAESARVGGDWYDAFAMPDDDALVMIGDVVGHDTAAAAAMGQVRGLTRGIAVITDAGPADLLRDVDLALSRLRLETSATSVVARFGSTTSAGLRLRWSNAGHPPPVLLVPGAPPRVLASDDPDLLLGFDPATERTEATVDLAPGAVVLLYTDGLVERRDRSLDDGIAAVATLLDDLVAAGHPLSECCDRVLAALPTEEMDDDVAFVAVRVTG